MAGVGWLTTYAIAMAHVEAALVIYLRRLYYAGDPLTLFPLEMLPNPDLAIELARELATLVMITAVAFLHAKRGWRVFAAFLYVFGLWDIAYYAWLKAMLGWPTSWLEWDVLFLIPWPWLGPWIAPVLAAAVFVIWGARTLLSSPAAPPLTRSALTAFAVGTAIVIGAFLVPGLTIITGAAPAEGYRPGAFDWALFALGYAIMTAGLFVKKLPKIRQIR
ncbi:MAG: hypothetical protein EHM50_06790 [Lysobacterales bacterium]|nr:MAG: hypothetical protein EHM50_06790 [Xanthomonadales bacterium]